MKTQNDVIVTSYIKILQILKLKWKDRTSQNLHAKFYASWVKNKRITPPPLPGPGVFKSPGKIALSRIQKVKTY